MAIDVVKGADKTVIAAIKQVNGDPYDLTGVNFIRACLQGEKDRFFKAYISFTANTTSTSAVLSNISNTDILEFMEGQPISGTGIPTGATVVSTPKSCINPSAANTIVISAAATATGTSVSMILGSITISSPINWGKVLIPLAPSDTKQLSSENFEIKLIDTSGKTRYAQYPGAFNLIERFC